MPIRQKIIFTHSQRHEIHFY